MFDKIRNLVVAVMSFIVGISTWLFSQNSDQRIIKNPITPNKIIEICDNNIATAESIAKNSQNQETIRYAQAVINENTRQKEKIISEIQQTND